MTGRLGDRPPAARTVETAGEIRRRQPAPITRAFIGPVYRIDPFDVANTKVDRVGYNPLAMVKGADDARLLGEALLGAAPQGGSDRFWYNEALNLLSGLILWFATEVPEDTRRMADLRDYITDAQFEKHLKENLEESPHPATSAACNMFLSKAEKERSGVRSHINSAMAIWDTPELRDATDVPGDLSFADLKRQNMTIYIILPLDKLTAYSAFLRLLVAQAADVMIRDRSRTQHPVVFMLDEFAAMGKMQRIQDGYATLAGMGVRLWVFFQNVHQAKDIYGEGWHTFLSESHTQSFFGVQDTETAKLVSERLGQRTVAVEGMQHGTSSGEISTGMSHGDSIGYQAVPLMAPDEVMDVTTRRRMQIVFQRGRAPTRASLNFWFEDERMRQKQAAKAFTR